MPYQRQFLLSFNLAPGVAMGDAVDAIQRAALEIGMPTSMYASFDGTVKSKSRFL